MAFSLKFHSEMVDLCFFPPCDFSWLAPPGRFAIQTVSPQRNYTGDRLNFTLAAQKADLRVSWKLPEFPTKTQNKRVNYPPWKVTGTQEERIVFQTTCFFKGVMLNFGCVYIFIYIYIFIHTFGPCLVKMTIFPTKWRASEHRDKQQGLGLLTWTVFLLGSIFMYFQWWWPCEK